MSYMNITKIEGEDKWRVDYVADHQPGEAVVDRDTAKLLEHAKQAGASEKAAEIRRLLELNW